ncbi:alpha/beta fold hydrolase [Citricoccus sp. SGAir0253]|uniref:alpha/beta fold hydrolase n=1 Tax=Citricoccus sp. SGAir0253 TaxID=2567881 RepID=UPI001FEDC46A|nr:alpha/beta hydrolase [Citricoccus sp. SGAir0253]
MMPPLHTVDVHGVRLAYRRAGRGHPLVLLHGALSDGREWHHQLAGLSEHCDVIAVDAPGCGGSADPVEDLTLEGYADLMAGFCAALGLDHPDLGGLSFGSVCVLAIQRHQPGLARRLVLASAYAGWAGSLPPEEVARRKEWMTGLLERPVEEWGPPFLDTVFGAATPPEVVAESMELLRSVRPACLHLLRPMADADLRDVLPTITAPTLLLYGERDERSPLSVARALQQAIPGSRLVVILGAGHGISAEAPGPFNEAVRDFLT